MPTTASRRTTLKRDRVGPADPAATNAPRLSSEVDDVTPLSTPALPAAPTRGPRCTAVKQAVMASALCATLTGMVPASVDAQAIYKWTDDQGITHYSTTPPPESARREHHLLDRQGQTRDVRRAPVVDTQDPEARAAALEAQRAAEAAAEAARRDEARARFLQQAFGSREEIQASHERRVQVLKDANRISESQERTLLRERARIAAQLEDDQRRPAERARYARELAELDQRIREERAARAARFDQQRRLERERDDALADWDRLIDPGPSSHDAANDTPAAADAAPPTP